MTTDKIQQLNEAVREALQELDGSDELYPTSTGEHQYRAASWFIVTKNHKHGFDIPWDGTGSNLDQAIESFKSEYRNHECKR